MSVDLKWVVLNAVKKKQLGRRDDHHLHGQNACSIISTTSHSEGKKLILPVVPG